MINHKLPFDPNKTRVDTPPMTIYEALRKIQRGHIRLNPEFQRNFVWSEQQQSRLIESILMRVPLPAFYLDATDEGQWQVIDGFQRLSTLYRFCKLGELRLKGLEFLDLEDASFDELPEPYQRILEDTPLTLIVVQPGTPGGVKFVIFQRINTGGVSLNPQEIRHALYEGPAREILQELAESAEFRAAAVGLSDTDIRRMEDRECVLRFLTLRLNPEYVGGLGEDNVLTYEALLNRTMDDLNQSRPVTLDQFRLEFRDSMVKAEQLFGDLAFREVTDPQLPGPFRKQLFDVWSIALTQQPLEWLLQRRDNLLRLAIRAMSDDAAFASAIAPQSDDWPSVTQRFKTVRDMLDTA